MTVRQKHTSAENALREQVESLHAEISESRRAHELLLEQQCRLRMFEHITTEVFWTMDLYGNFTYISPSVEHLWGYSPEEIMRLTLADILTPTSLAVAMDANRRSSADIQAGLISLNNFRKELEQVCKDGTLVWAEITMSYVFDANGAFQEKRGVTRDITERKCHELLLEEACEVAESAKRAMAAEIAECHKAEELLLEHQCQLAVLNQELEARVIDEVMLNRKRDQELIQIEKMSSLGQLAAGVAHEINNPMSYISSNLRVLANYFQQIILFDRSIQEICDEGQVQKLREIISKKRTDLVIDDILKDGLELIEESLEGAQRVAIIVQDLKIFTRVDKVDKATREWVTLDSCLDRALNICFNELKCVASIRKEYEPPSPVFCNSGQLNQVFLNLLVNAGQSILTRGEIVLKCWHDKEFSYASVSDTGQGIPDEIRLKIFEPFFTTKDVGMGTGLGLSVSFEIVKNHNGTLLVESEDGTGTTFTVILPRVVPLAPGPEANST